jgi:hypothetical protein
MNSALTFTAIAEAGGGGFWMSPDRIGEPELYRLWTAMTSSFDLVTPEISIIKPGEPKKPRSPPPPPPLPPSPSVPKGGANSTRFGKILSPSMGRSRNWAGASVPANKGRRFTRIGGRWTHPHSPDEPKRGKSSTRMSVWIGLGGSERWANSMPQMGSEYGWNPGEGVVNNLWCQWWLGNRSTDGYRARAVGGIGCNAGDDLLCMLTVVDPKTVEFYFKNQTTGRLGGVRASSRFDVIGSSAEWVVERPVKPSGEHPPAPDVLGDPALALLRYGIWDLPMFSECTMTECGARLGTAGDFRAQTLAHADTIDLIAQASDCSRIYQQLEADVLSRNAGTNKPHTINHHHWLDGQIDLSLVVTQ